MSFSRQNTDYKLVRTVATEKDGFQTHLATKPKGVTRGVAPVCTPKHLILRIDKNPGDVWMDDEDVVTCSKCITYIQEHQIPMISVLAISNPPTTPGASDMTDLSDNPPDQGEGNEPPATTPEQQLANSTQSAGELGLPDIAGGGAFTGVVGGRVLVIPASLPLTSIDLDALVITAGRERPVQLPGGEIRGSGNRITLRQQMMIARYIVEHPDEFVNAVTWADAIAQMRKNWLTGNQWDFQIATHIASGIRRSNAHLDLTELQENLVQTIVSAFSGQEEHWDPQIARKIREAKPELITRFLDRFIEVGFEGNQGMLNKSMNMFNSVFGFPQRRANGDPMDGLNAQGDDLQASGALKDLETSGTY